MCATRHMLGIALAQLQPLAFGFYLLETGDWMIGAMHLLFDFKTRTTNIEQLAICAVSACFLPIRRRKQLSMCLWLVPFDRNCDCSNWANMREKLCVPRVWTFAFRSDKSVCISQRQMGDVARARWHLVHFCIVPLQRDYRPISHAMISENIFSFDFKHFVAKKKKRKSNSGGSDRNDFKRPI